MAIKEDNFYDSELIVEFLKGILPGDLHLKIQAQIKASEMFRAYVEGVQINFEQSGKKIEKMEADTTQKKAQAWSKLQEKINSPTNLGKQISYTLEQLKDFFLPNPQLQLALQYRRASEASKAQIAIDDTAETLTLILHKKHIQVIDFEIFNNKIQSVQKQKIPAHVKDFTLSIASLHPGIYYAELKPKNAAAYMIRFYIHEDLKPK